MTLSSNKVNRLGSEKSVYLLQHATNPVDWYPWGEEAIKKAKTEDKLIFLSIGYSTCHWCHVMDRESFSSSEIASILNRKFVSIKVDREERPDVDKIYMTYVQAATGQGGWPLNVWLTPDLKPLYGCTYLPPDEREQKDQKNLKTLLRKIASRWKSEKDKVLASGDDILQAMASDAHMPQVLALSTTGGGKSGTDGNDSTRHHGEDWVKKCFLALLALYDRANGGFGTAPKFPQPVNLNFLFSLYATGKNEGRMLTGRDMALQTLRKMAHGGIRDHIGGGFHRYSTDSRWHVPHFEKMLCDQAQMAVAYASAYQITGNVFFSNVSKEVLEYVALRLSHKEGGFYSGEDADSLPSADAPVKKEGAFYVWTSDELKILLSQPVAGVAGVTLAEIFMDYYHVKIGGNVDAYQDTQHELDGKNVLYSKDSLEELAIKYGCVQQDIRDVLEQSKRLLLEAQNSTAWLQRPRPNRDTKMVAAWNGLMISAFAIGAQAFDEPRYAARAEAAAQFLINHLYNEGTNTLLRSCYGDDDSVVQLEMPIEGFAEDYSFVIRGFLDLYETSFDDKWLERAEQLQNKQDELFWDASNGGYFNSSSRDITIVMRLKEEQDGAEPCASSIAAGNLLRLGAILNKDNFTNKAVKIFESFTTQLDEVPLALPELLASYLVFKHGCKQVVIVGDKDDRKTKNLLRAAHNGFVPNKVLIVPDDAQKWLNHRVPFYKSLTMVDGAPAAYVCEHSSSKQVATSAEYLEVALSDHKVVMQSKGCVVL